MERVFYSAREISEMTGISVQVIYRLARNREIEHLRIGKNVRFRLQDFIFKSEREGEEND